MNAIVTCWCYDDFLAITLPRNARHFDRVLVVTTDDDQRTIDVAKRELNVEVLTTDVFFSEGAPFDKGRALDLGLQVLGMEGWIVIWDADTIMPDEMDFSGIERGNLYSPYRRVCEDRRMFTAELEWGDLPMGYETINHQFPGYFQLFEGSDPVLRRGPPWHGTEFKTAQGADTIFQNNWPPGHHKRLPFEVLHLGPLRVNWAGRVSRRWDSE